ncbi:Transcription cofactor vestigial-like protein 3 [Fukomys damarensis]|uniref:Transcription cofactor vestigial-like protein 3 n=1 Tax=Fukomys damarensis TaxID=885580 RepID=A0A091D1X9_FUKDA|nr:Transcription cofactor vestigial-like protein 3 [Fukomys damarensis]
MSCAEVMYHPQPYGAPQYLPNPVAAATCPTACYQPAPQPGQQGDIGSVVDEHFSRALGQASTFHPESAISKSKMGLTPLWRDSSALSSQRSNFPASFWTSSYQPPPAPCLGGVHPDFQVTSPPGTFTPADPSPWSGHGLHQTGPPPPPPVSESWHYPLASQVSPSYSHMHDVYMRHHHPHTHMHHRHHHHHHHHHHHPAAGSALDPSYGPLLMPSVRAARLPAPQCDIAKTDPSAVTTATSAWAGAFHGTVDIVPSVGFDTGGSDVKVEVKECAYEFSFFSLTLLLTEYETQTLKPTIS